MFAVTPGLRLSARSNFRVYLLLFLMLLAIGWLFTYPPYGVSDEPAHTVKALAVANGEFEGPKTVGQFGYAAEVFNIPATFSSIFHFVCYGASLDTTPDCVGNFPDDPTTVVNTSTAATYPPLYYALVGWLGWIFPTQAGFYMMRGMGLIAVLGVLILAFRSAAKASNSVNREALLFVACTPAFVSFMPVVNPFALEVALALCFWLQSLAFLEKNASSNVDKVLIVFVGVSFGLTRPASFIWMFSILLILVIFEWENPFKQDSRQKWTWIISGGLLSILISGGWYVHRLRDVPLGGGGQGYASIWANLRHSFENLDDNFLQLFGHFGWTSFYPPLIVPVLGIVAIFLLATAPTCGGEKRNLLQILVPCAVLAAPLVLEGLRASSAGLGYQGRYILPIAVGLPVLWSRRLSPSEGRITCAIFMAGAANLIALGYSAHRYLVGVSGPYWWLGREKWQPPINGIGLMIIWIAAASALLLAILSLQRFSRPQTR